MEKAALSSRSRNRPLSWFIVSLLLLSTIETFSLVTCRTQLTQIIVLDNYPVIQEAANSAIDRDSISARDSTYSARPAGPDALLLADSALELNKTYGGTESDFALAFVQTVDGGYALAGRTYSFGAGGSDFWLVKTDAFGNHLWNRTYGGTGDDCAHALVQTADGGYALAGTTYSFGAGRSDFWLVKTDSAGNTMWNRTYGGTKEDDPAHFVVQTADGGYALAGRTYSFGPVGSNIWFIKTDASGNMLWNRIYGGSSLDGVFAFVQTVDGGYALAGHTYSFGAGNCDFWLVKTDSAGNTMWNETYGGTGDDWPYALIQTTDGGYALTGYTDSFGAGNSDVWLVRTDAFGNHLWNRTYGGTGEEDAYAFVQTVDGGYALAGHTYSFGAGNCDAWLVKTSADGSHEWNETYGGIGEDYACRLIPTGNDGYVLAGSTQSFGAGSDDFWLVKTVRDVPTIIVPDDYLTIQEAINNAAEGAMVFVRAGTYYEHVIVSKSLTLLGEDKETTIIDGNMTGNVVRVIKDYVNIRGFTIQRSGRAYTNSGIYVGSTRHCDISANYIVDNEYGVHGSPRNTSITDNTIEGNFFGVDLQSGATSNVISRNHLVANYVSVHLNQADANYILQNNMTNNYRSVTLWESKNNKVYHNNFLNNTFGSVTTADPNFLDNGLEGNYWSNYTGVDLNHDGVGDSPYVIDANHTDHYPLMGMFSSFNTSYGYAVDFVSNSSILNANFIPNPIIVYPPEAILTFNISGETGTRGFLRVCIPKILINGSYVVRFNDEVITNTTYPWVRELPCSNETYTYFYINYTHSEHTITITGTSACVHRSVVVPNDYSTIQEAINNAIDGDMIYVKAGVYCEHVVVNKTVTLLGEDVGMTIVDGNGTGNVFTVYKNNVNITGFTVQNGGGVLGNAGLRLDNASFCCISGNRIRDNFAGIWFEGSSKNLITANEIAANVDDGIVFNYSHNNTISENQIALHEYFGIVINWSHNNTICYNNVTQTHGPSHGDGINLWRSSSNNIFQNRVEENARYGIRIETQSNNNTVSDNTIRNCTTGLQVYDYSDYNCIYGNRIANCSSGIELSKADLNKVFLNNITANDVGAAISYSRDNMFYSNNFMNNTQQVSISIFTYANAWDSEYPNGGNYWSDYSGVDVKRGLGQDLPGSDGIGDIVYVIYADNRDRYPLMNPYASASPPMNALTIMTMVGGITNPAPETYSYTVNSQVQVTAIPNIGYVFDHWELDIVNVGSFNPYMVLIDKNHTLKAVFKLIPPSVGGHSVSISEQATATPLTPYLTLTAFIAIALTTIKRIPKKLRK